MNRALIAIASIGILAPSAWSVAANAQQMSRGPAPPQAYAPSQIAPTQANVQRKVRRSARRTPAAAAPRGTAAATAPAGSAYAAAPGGRKWEWAAAPGPKN